MRARHTEHTNRLFTLAGGTEENDLWVYDMEDDEIPDGYGDNVVCSVWEPTAQERVAIANGQNVRVMFWVPKEWRTPPLGVDVTDEKLTPPPARRLQAN